jgi:hypothetical protein
MFAVVVSNPVYSPILSTNVSTEIPSAAQRIAFARAETESLSSPMASKTTPPAMGSQITILSR